MSLRSLTSILVLAVVVTACAGNGVGESGDTTSTSDLPGGELAQRLSLIEEAVEAWGEAGSIKEAHVSAERAANLVVGPNGPAYGDRNGDGEISGESAEGLLPGVDGSPRGIALSDAANRCVQRDVLGGSWEDPQAAWNEMLSAIDSWGPGNNTMPTLASHPMRVVGWATFTLATESLERAHEYAGHAGLHVAISMRALEC